MSACFSEEAM